MAASTLPVMSRALDSCSSAWSGNMDRRVSRFASPPPLLPPPLIVAPSTTRGVFRDYALKLANAARAYLPGQTPCWTLFGLLAE